MLKRFLLTILVLGILNVTAVAQIRTDNDEADKKRNNTENIFYNIENYSKKRKFTMFLHNLIFKSNIKNPATITNQYEIDVSNNIYRIVQGKVIRKIKIVTLDPFGYSEADTTKAPTSSNERLGNKLHLKTKRITIKNLLIFKENQHLDSLTIKESERLIRTQRYIKKVRIEPITLAHTKDSVDISIRVLDSWSLYSNGEISSSYGTLRLVERNFGGLGHEFSNRYSINFIENKHAYTTRYHINNIKNTFISTTFFHEKDLEGNFLNSWATERPLYSTYTKLAGGIQLYQRYYRDSISDITGNKKFQEFEHFTQDYWLAYAIPIFKGNKKTANTNLITSIRYVNKTPINKVPYKYDTLGIYSNKKSTLLSIGLSSINYKQDKYIFNHDIIEDIRVGEVLAITTGIQEYLNKNRLYLGTQLSFGTYTKYGYISTNLELGSYFYDYKAEQSAVRIEALYFTNLLNIGRWKFRNFIRSQFTIGYNRIPNIEDSLRLDTSEGIEGFKADNLRGINRGILSLQLQSYAPTNWMGFRFNPYLNTEFGFLGNKNNYFSINNIYSKFGIGVVVNNDYLVFNNIQISLAYYPKMPDRGNNIFKANSIRNNNLNLKYFNYDGKPSTVPYR